jgi:hypothetical protein
MTDVSVRDQLVADAKTLPGLIAAAQVADPALANALLGKATSAAATQAGAVVTGGVALLATHYGLGWSDATVATLGGLVTLFAGLAINWLQVRLHIGKLVAA